MLLQNNFQLILDFWLGIVFENDSIDIVKKASSSDKTNILESTFPDVFPNGKQIWIKNPRTFIKGTFNI